LAPLPQKPTTGCKNNAYIIRPTERFAVTTDARKDFTSFPEGGGQVPPLIHACGLPWA